MIDFIFYLLTFALVVNLVFFPICRIVDTTKAFMYRERKTMLGNGLQYTKAALLGWTGMDDDDLWEFWMFIDLFCGFVYWVISVFFLCTTWFWWVPLLPIIWLVVGLGGRAYIDSHNDKYGTKL